MTINVAHLYYDILNLYGESGNIKAIKNYLEKLGIKVNIHFITLDDEISLDNIDLIYIGSGTENNQDLVLKHLLKYKEKINSFIENNKYILATGNAMELFGKSIDKNKALGIFNYSTTRTDFRIVSESLFKSNLIKENILGFQNRGSYINNIDNYLFDTIKGTGSNIDIKKEGFNYKNFYGTYLIGPLLVRNPAFLKYLINKLIKEKDKNFKINEINLDFEEKAYTNFINLYYNNI